MSDPITSATPDAEAGPVEESDPFAGGPLEGFIDWDDLIERTQRAPSEAAPWYANGAVAWWYGQRSWQYPVEGPLGEGDDAVRRYFVALGLPDPFQAAAPTSPRPAHLAPIELRGLPRTTIAHQVVIRPRAGGPWPTTVRAESPEDWLRIASVESDDAGVNVVLMVDSVPAYPGETFEALVQFTVNDAYHAVQPVVLRVEEPEG